MPVFVRLVRTVVHLGAIGLGRAAVEFGLPGLVRTLLLIAVGLVAPICLGETASIADARFEILKSGAMPGVYSDKSRLTLVRDETEFRRIWAELTAGTALASSEPPKVDFGHSMVVVFFAAFGDNCDPYQLVRVIARPDKLTLEIVNRVPGNLCTCASVVFAPYILIRIDRTTRPIDYLIQSETRDCA